MTTQPRRYPNGEPDLYDPRWHEDDGHGGCVICLFYVPYTDDDQTRQQFPCAVVREAAHERPADAALNDPRVQHILDIAKKAAEYGRATNGSGKRMTGSLEVALARLDILLQWEGEHPQAHARLAAQPSPEPAEQEGTER